MTAVALALLSSVAYGFTDFLGGMASRRASVLVVGSIGQPVGMLLLLPLLLFPVFGGDLSLGAVGWGVLSGLGGAAAYFFLFRSLAIGPMSVASPLSALTSAILPVLAGVAFGEVLSAGAVAGIVLGLVAVLLISRQHEQTPHPVSATVVVMALAAGVFISVFFIALERSPDTSGLWPLVVARLVAAVLLLGAALIRRVPLSTGRSVLGIASAAAVLDVVATAAFLLATRYGLLSVVAVITALYPGATILMARLALGERMQWLQKFGLAMAAVSVSVLAVVS